MRASVDDPLGAPEPAVDAVVTIDWTTELADQLDFHWTNHVRPRLEGLTDAELHWEPAPGAWGVRTVDGTTTIDWAFPEPDPVPVTTIAWRLAHVAVGVFGQRAASHFGGPPTSYADIGWCMTAAGVLARLDDSYDRWRVGVRGLDAAGLGRPVGPAEGSWHASPMATLVLHINREAIHHLAEVLVLRDMHRSAGADGLPYA